jgi:hypothetical protein
MRTLLLFWLCSCLLPLLLPSQTTTFNKRMRFGYPAVVFSSVVPTDSCYYVTGVFADSVPPYLPGNIFVKFDLEGGEVFHKVLTSSNQTYETFHNTLLNDGARFLNVGYTQTASAYNGLLICYNDLGDTLFTKVYDNPYFPIVDYFSPFDIKRTPDGSFVILSWMDTPNLSEGDYSILKIDSLGNELWHKWYGTNMLERPKTIVVSDEGSIIVGGGRGNDNLVTQNFTYQTWILGLDSLGNVEWEYLSPADSLRDAANDMLLLEDGSLIVASARGDEYYIPSVSTIYFDKAIFKLNADHELEWERFFFDNSEMVASSVEALCQVDSSSFVAVGSDFYWEYFPAPGKSINQGWLFKCTTEGDSIWVRKHVFLDNNRNNHLLSDIKKTPDGGFVLVGQARDRSSQAEYPQQGWLLKVDEHGCLVPGCHLTSVEELPNASFSITLTPYPNPAGEELFLFFRPPDSHDTYQFRIFDLQGREMWAFSHTGGATTFILDSSSWPAGSYWVQVLHEGQVVGSSEGGSRVDFKK